MRAVLLGLGIRHMPKVVCNCRERRVGRDVLPDAQELVRDLVVDGRNHHALHALYNASSVLCKLLKRLHLIAVVSAFK